LPNGAHAIPAQTRAIVQAHGKNFDRIAFEMLRFLTAGESPGQGLVVITDGIPAGLPPAP